MRDPIRHCARASSAAVLVLAAATLLATPAARADDAALLVSVTNEAQLDGGTFAAAKAAALAEAGKHGARVRDISELYRALFIPGMVSPTFDRPVPSALDRATAADWTTVQKTCAERMKRLAQDPASNPAVVPQRAIACQSTGMAAVFARFLEREHSPRVLVLRILRERTGPGAVRISSALISRADATMVVLFKDTEPPDVPASIPGVAADALAKKGTAHPWRMRTTLPEVADAALLDAAATATSAPTHAPVPLPGACPANRLPRALIVDGGGLLSATLTARYGATAATAGAARKPKLACDGVASDEVGLEPSVRAGLLCPGLPPIFESATQPPGGSSVIDALSTALLRDLFVRLCGGTDP